jgi:riboflavin kinase
VAYRKSVSLSLAGSVVSGLGEGRYYMSKGHYRRQFIKKFDIDPYRGTLNIRLSALNSRRLARIKRRKGILITGSKKRGKILGEVLCYRADLSGINCALVIPRLSKNTDVAEIVASERLRSALKLKDGSRIKVSVKL